MLLPRVPSQKLLRRVVERVKAVSNPRALTAFLKSSSTDRGRERYRRASITASTSLIARVLTIAISFVSVPLTVHYLGAERYGVWLTISSLLTWMAMTDFGLAGNALVNVLSEANGKDDRRVAQQYAASAFWALSAIGSALGIAFFLSFRFVPWRAIFRVSGAVSTAELNTTCALMLAFFAFNIPLSLLGSIYNAYQDGFVSNVWSIAINGLSLISLIVVSRIHGGLPQLILALSGTRALVLVANAYHAFFVRYRWLAPALSAVRWSCIKRLLTLGGKYMVTQLAGLGIYQSQPMIITQLLGPSYVVIFVIAQKIITLPMDLVFMATSPFISAFGEAKARRDWKWIKSAYLNSTKLSLLAGAPLTIAIALAAKPIIRIWAGSAAVPNAPLVLWLSVYTLVGISLMAAGQMMCGLERVEPLAVSIILCAIAVVGLSILFAPWWGLSGIAFAMAVSKLTAYWPIQVYEVRRIFRFEKPEPVVEQPEYAV